ncbi:MAG: hypothetical protein ACK5S9_13775, partial [Roseiflexaceae bacterium]
MLSATSLRTRMRRMCVHIIVFVSVISALLPSGVAAQADARPGRFVIAPEPKARTVTTTEDMFYGQLTTGSTRSIVLNWAQTAARMGSYDVYKSVGTGTAETKIGTTTFVADATALSTAFVTAPRQLLALRHAYSTTGLYTDTVSVSTVYDNLA